ncbi:MAG: methyl-accepting chemotaxis protein [Firmicutes bacterium]|nr:methyl-accepting chemotaxis protein [Bacillota bacterium]
MNKIIRHKKEKCVACNRCIKHCPIKEANVSSLEDDKMSVIVDDDKCISCGACIDACHHGARNFLDDTKQFFEDLANGEPISIMIAPAIRTNFKEGEWRRFITWFRELGIQKVFDVSLGADICTWVHVRYLQRHRSPHFITQPCPAIVNYVLLHKNELLKHLSPVHSPMLCTAIYMRKHEHINTKIAALSPCIAKASEFSQTGEIQYNVTFRELRKYIERNNITLPTAEGDFDSQQSGLGSVFPMPGGLKENVSHYLGHSIRIDESEGESVVYKALDEYAKQLPSTAKLPNVFDVLSCPDGCNMGTGCDIGKVNIFDVNTDMYARKHDSTEFAKNKAYLDQLFEMFDKTLRQEDFIRQYKPMPIRPIPVTDAEIEKAMTALGKFTDEERNFDCGACGYDSCLEMATAIAKNINTPYNCLEKSHKDTKEKHTEIRENVQNFNKTLTDITYVKELTQKINEDMHDITSAINAYNHMVSDAESIALQVNLISLNASIEAARVGSRGNAFGIVAEEIRRLAKVSKDSAKKTREAASKANSAIDSVNSTVVEISDGVKEAYENIENVYNKIKED